jgi:lysophospholipase L1-like esterase
VIASIHSLLLTLALSACMWLTPLAGNAENAAAQANTPKKPTHRSLREGMFALSRMDSASVVMLGDSLTERGQWAEITGCQSLANRGIGGDDSGGVLRRVGEVIKLKPSAVFLMVGVNDVNSSVPTETIVDNVRQTIERLTKGGAQVQLTLVLPVTKSYPRQLNVKVNELNGAYRKLAEETKTAVIDLRHKMQTTDGSLRDALSIDGLHLSAEGYRVWRDAIEPLVLQHCQPTPDAPQKAQKTRKRSDQAPRVPEGPVQALATMGEQPAAAMSKRKSANAD